MNKKENLVYVLSKPNYFSRGTWGHVTHAIGVVEGFVKNGWNVRVLSGLFEISGHNIGTDCSPQSGDFIFDEEPPITKGFLKSLRWKFRLLKKLKASNRNQLHLVIFRYAISQPLYAIAIAQYVKRYTKANCVVEVNSLSVHTVKKIPTRFRHHILWLESKIVNQFDFVYVVSGQVERDLVSVGTDKNKIITVPNGASIGTVVPPSKYPSPQTINTRLVYAGVLQKYYDFFLLIRAVNSLPSNFVLGSSTVTLHGRYERDSLPLLLDENSDIFVLPYSDSSGSNRGSPVKLYEYMSLRIPILATNTGQIPEILTSGVNGFFYEDGDIKSLVAAIENVCQLKDRNLYAKRAYRDFCKNYTWEVRMKQLIDGIKS